MLIARVVESGRGAREPSALGDDGAKTGAVTVVQRTSSDLKLNPHLYVVLLDSAYGERGGDLVFRSLGHLRTREVGEVLERVVRRIARCLRRRDRRDWREHLPLMLRTDHAP
jgi:hypothetical protein